MELSLPVQPTPSLSTDASNAKSNEFLQCVQVISQNAILQQAAFDELKKVNDEIHLIGASCFSSLSYSLVNFGVSQLHEGLPYVDASGQALQCFKTIARLTAEKACSLLSSLLTFRRTSR
jgi:hypothetical protein